MFINAFGLLVLLPFAILFTVDLSLHFRANAITSNIHCKRSFHWQENTHQLPDDDVDFSSLEPARQASQASYPSTDRSNGPSSYKTVNSFLREQFPHEHQEYVNAQYMYNNPESPRAAEYRRQNHRTLAQIRQDWKRDGHPAYQFMRMKEKEGRQRYNADPQSYPSLIEQARTGSITPDGAMRLEGLRQSRKETKRSTEAKRKGDGGSG